MSQGKVVAKIVLEAITENPQHPYMEQLETENKALTEAMETLIEIFTEDGQVDPIKNIGQACKKKLAEIKGVKDE